MHGWPVMGCEQFLAVVMHVGGRLARWMLGVGECELIVVAIRGGLS